MPLAFALYLERTLVVNRIAILSLFVVCLGCSGGTDGPTMHPVKGTVTLDGTPLAEGAIVLDPSDGSGTPVMGGVKDGSFTLEAPAGNKIVRFSASKVTDEEDEYGEKISISLVPDKYNGTSELTVTIAEGENTIGPFELKSE